MGQPDPESPVPTTTAPFSLLSTLTEGEPIEYRAQIFLDQEYGHSQPPPPLDNKTSQFQQIGGTRGGSTYEQKEAYQLNPAAPSFIPKPGRSDRTQRKKEGTKGKDLALESHRSTTQGPQKGFLPSTDITPSQQPSSQIRLDVEFPPSGKDFRKLLQEKIEQLSKQEQTRLQTTPSLPRKPSLWSKTQSCLQEKHPQIFDSLNSELAKRTAIIFPSKVFDDTGTSLLTLSWEASFKFKQPFKIAKDVLDFQKKIITTVFAVDRQIGLEMSSFAWNCIWLLLLVSRNLRHHYFIIANRKRTTMKASFSLTYQSILVPIYSKS